MTNLRFCSMLLPLLAVAAPAAAQEFGGSSAVSGRDVLIGQPSNQYAPGQVYVFRANQQGAWSEAARIGAPDSATNTGFGRRIAVDGSTMLVAESPNDSSGAGRVHVYERSQAGAWRHAGTITPTPSVNGDRIGRGLALKGDVAVIGASRTDSLRGEAWVFRRAGGQWRQEARLRPAEVAPGAAFGNTVAFDGTHLAVGAQQADSNAGAVYLFRRDSAGAWAQEQKLTLPLPESSRGNAQFGAAIQFHGNELYVGAPGLTNFMGAVVRFARDTVNQRWNVVGGLLPFEASPGTQFGTSFTLIGSELWVGAPGASQFEGRIFRYAQDADGAFTNVTRVAYDTAGRQYAFGSLVSGAGSIAVVGMGTYAFGEGRAAIITVTTDGRPTQPTVPR